MKYVIKFSICLLLSLLGINSVNAQECPKPSFETKIGVEKTASRKVEDYEDWREIKSKYISFFAPQDLKELKVTCYEGGCSSFESKDIHIGIDTNSAAFYPYYEKTFPSYNEKLFCINGRIAWFWSYEDDEGYKYHAGVFFYFEGDSKRRLVVNFNSKDKDIKQTAEKIVKSIEFIKQK